MSELVLRRSVCPHSCWDTCSVLAAVADGRRVVKVIGDPDHPTTRGFLCVKGYRLHDRTHSEDRVLTPLRRTGPKGEGYFAPISWGEALTLAAERLGALPGRAILPYHSTGTAGHIQGGSMANRFFDRLGARRLTEPLCRLQAATADSRAAAPHPAELASARLIIIWGLNLLSTNVHQWPYIQEARRQGARLVVIDPFAHGAARAADLHLQIKPGSDLALARALLQPGPPDPGTEAICGLPLEQIERVKQDLAAIRPVAIRMGTGPDAKARQAAAALMAQVGGQLLFANAPAAAGLDLDALSRPDLRPPGDEAPPVPMTGLGEALKAEHGIAALIIHGANPAVTAPDQAAVLEGLGREDLFTIVAEQMLTDTARYADLILPATTAFEHLDLYTSSWHHDIMLAEPVIPPLGEAVPNTEIFRRLAGAMGFSDPCFADTDEELIRQALASGDPALDGVTLEALRERGWLPLNLPQPAPLPDPPSASPTLTPHVQPGTYHLLTPTAHHFQQSTFANIPALMGKEKAPHAYIHPADAASHAIVPGDWVKLSSERGHSFVQARVGTETRPGVIIAPGFWWLRYSPESMGLNQLPADIRLERCETPPRWVTPPASGCL